MEGGPTDGTRENIEAEIQKRPGRKPAGAASMRQWQGTSDEASRRFLLRRIDIHFGRRSFRKSGGADRPMPDNAEGKRGLSQRQPLCSTDEPVAVRPLNWLGSKVFARLMSFLLGQRFSDTLCGTKVFFREDFLLDQNPVARMDPFGDYGLLISAGLRNLRIREAPLDYRARRYGQTNI